MAHEMSKSECEGLVEFIFEVCSKKEERRAIASECACAISRAEAIRSSMSRIDSRNDSVGNNIYESKGGTARVPGTRTSDIGVKGQKSAQ